MNGFLHQPGSFDPDSIFRVLEDAAERMVAAKEKADNLTELKKSILAAKTLDFFKDKIPRIEAEMKALADEDYQQYLRGMNEAVRQANRAQAHYKNALVLAELRRTEESSRRSLRT